MLRVINLLLLALKKILETVVFLRIVILASQSGF